MLNLVVGVHLEFRVLVFMPLAGASEGEGLLA